MTHSRNGERMLSCSFLPFSKSQSLTTIHTNSCTHVVPKILMGNSNIFVSGKKKEFKKKQVENEMQVRPLPHFGKVEM